MTDKVEAAVEKFTSGYNCAQAVLYAHSDDLNLDKDTALKLACGFGAGMARQSQVCGAVTGGMLVLSAIYGRGENDDRAATDKTYAKTQELLERFRGRHGSYNCRDLLEGADLMTAEGQRHVNENKLVQKTCTECVRSVVQILGEIQAP